MNKYLVILIFWSLAFVILRFRRKIKEFTGDIAFAEKYLGSGGTNTLIVIIGVLVFILSLMYAVGTLQGITNALLGPFFG